MLQKLGRVCARKSVPSRSGCAGSSPHAGCSGSSTSHMDTRSRKRPSPPPSPRSLQGERVPCRHLNFNPAKLILDFWSPKLWETPRLDWPAMEHVVIGTDPGLRRNEGS